MSSVAVCWMGTKDKSLNKSPASFSQTHSTAHSLAIAPLSKLTVTLSGDLQKFSFFFRLIVWHLAFVGPYFNGDNVCKINFASFSRVSRNLPPSLSHHGLHPNAVRGKKSRVLVATTRCREKLMWNSLRALSLGNILWAFGRYKVNFCHHRTVKMDSVQLELSSRII